MARCYSDVTMPKYGHARRSSMRAVGGGAVWRFCQFCTLKLVSFAVCFCFVVIFNLLLPFTVSSPPVFANASSNFEFQLIVGRLVWLNDGTGAFKLLVHVGDYCLFCQKHTVTNKSKLVKYQLTLKAQNFNCYKYNCRHQQSVPSFRHLSRQLCCPNFRTVLVTYLKPLAQSPLRLNDCSDFKHRLGSSLYLSFPYRLPRLPRCAIPLQHLLLPQMPSPP